MKKIINLLAILIVLTVLTLTNSQALSQKTYNSITGEAITGDATMQHAQLSIQVVGILPTLSLISPRNTTYFTKNNILLNYTVSNERFVWYHIDSGFNTTISSPILFNITANGAHKLYIYANNSDGNYTFRNITFTVNNTRFNVSYEEFREQNDDETTNFDSYGYEEIQNLSNISLEKSNFGKINFQEIINVTECNNNLCDLTNNVNISFNRIELNSSAIPNFNKSAILTLYNLTFINPRILKDGAVCSSSKCAKISYSSGTLTFNVTSFSTYSAEETSSSSDSGSSGSSSSTSSGDSSEGSGAGGIVENPPFAVYPSNIAINLKKGESIKDTIMIINSNRSDISIELSSDLEELLEISEQSFNLTKGQSKEINIEFRALENLTHINYLGNIIVKSRITEIKIPVSITLDSKDSLFDVKISINKSNSALAPGEEVISSLRLYNLGNDRTQVKATYQIKSQDNRIILQENETLYVNKELFLEKIFTLPEDTQPGQYILYALIEYGSEKATSSVWFTIKTRKEITLDKIRIPLLTVIGLTLIGMILTKILKKSSKKFK